MGLYGVDRQPAGDFDRSVLEHRRSASQAAEPEEIRPIRSRPRLAIDLCGIEQLVSVYEAQLRLTALTCDGAVEARASPGMTCSARLLDPNPHCILIAIHPHLDHALGVTRTFALLPELLARATVIPGLARYDGLAQRLVIHMRDHQHVARRGIGGNASHKTGRIEFGLKIQPFLDIM